MGFYATSADESARTLLGHDLTWRKALEPFVWPPFYKVFVGLALKIHDDLFVTPRVLSQAFGLATIVVVALLAQQLFHDRAVSLAAAALSLFINHRFLFSVAPMSDIFYTTFVLAAFCFIAAWIGKRRPSALLGASAFLLLASTVRYEGCFIAAVFGSYVLYLWWVRREIGHGVALASVALIAAFPVYWIGASLAFYGNLENLSVTSWQGDSLGFTPRKVFIDNHVTRFVRDALMTPAILGLGALALLVTREERIRRWALLVFVPLLVIAGVVVTTGSATGSATWRLGGVWTLALLPFAALTLREFAGRFELPPLRPLAFVIGTLACCAAFAADTVRTYPPGQTWLTRQDLALGRAIQALPDVPARRLLLESEFRALPRHPRHLEHARRLRPDHGR